MLTPLSSLKANFSTFQELSRWNFYRATALYDQRMTHIGRTILKFSPRPRHLSCMEILDLNSIFGPQENFKAKVNLKWPLLLLKITKIPSFWHRKIMWVFNEKLEALWAKKHILAWKWVDHNYRLPAWSKSAKLFRCARFQGTKRKNEKQSYVAPYVM